MVDIAKLDTEEFSEYLESDPDVNKSLGEDGDDRDSSSSHDSNEDRKAGVYIKNQYNTRMD